MDNKKTTKIIIVFVASFFYYILLFIGINLILKIYNKYLPDSILMMSLYFTFITTLIYALKDQLINKLVKKKQIKYSIIIAPIIILLIGISLTMSSDYKESNKDPQKEILENGKKVYEKAEVTVDMTDINPNLIFKEEGDKLLSKDQSGNILQYKPKHAKDMQECAYLLYTLEDGYLLACSSNKNINYFTYTGDSEDLYYQLNINEKDLKNLKSQKLSRINANNTKMYQKYEIDNTVYYTEQAYKTFTLLKQFNDEYYIRIKTWDLEKEIKKTHDVKEWEVRTYYIKFIGNNYRQYLAKCSLDETLNLNIEYIKQEQ